MNEFSVRKLSKVVYGDEGVVSKYRMLKPHSGTDRPFNLFAGAHKSHTECSAVRYGERRHRIAERGALPLLRAYTCATPPSTNSSIPVIRRIRETHGLGNLIGYAEPAERNSIGNQFLLLFADF